ncbi:MAG TPA: hypothetical protein VG820_12750 [Fimbriimonadaceae bacterium]|nr:hypothetical protein [Fimbriimonadaceae bacterium]
MGQFGAAGASSLRQENRLVIFKVTDRVFGGTRSGYISIQSVGNAMDYGGGLSIAMDRPTAPTAQNPYQSRYETRSVAEDAAATSTKARLCLTTPLEETATIDCRSGATAKFAGETYTIVSVGKATDEFAGMRMAGDEKRPTWEVKLKATHNSARPVMTSLTALDASGQAIRYADLRGKPVADAQYMEEMRKRQETMMTPGIHRAVPSPYQQAVGYGISRNEDGEQIEILYVDPAKVSKFQIHGQTSKYVDITGIPLDPR